ncbi:MAG: ATP-binding protein [Actinomycetota bacterium]|nr:ATP-binding protein [Actinomycetota bacterium]
MNEVRSLSTPWQQFADRLLQQEALCCRLGQGVPPREFAGMYVDSAEVERILSTLPGLDGPPRTAAEPLLAETSRALEVARQALHDSLTASSPFADLVARARLAGSEVEVLALLLAVETDAQRQRLVAYIQDSISLPRVTLALLRRLFPAPGLLAVAPSSRLSSCSLVSCEDGGTWATRMLSVAPRVVWFLLGDSSPDPELPAGARIVDGLAAADMSGRNRGPARQGAPCGEPTLLLIPGGDRSSRLGQAVSGLPGSRYLPCPLPTSEQQWDAVMREATVSGLDIIIDVDRDFPASAAQRITRAAHLSWALLSPYELPVGSLPDRPWTELRVNDDPAGPRDWVRVVGTDDDRGHRLSHDQLHLLARAMPGLDHDIDAAVRRLASGGLDGLALRVRPQRGWPDLILGSDQHQRLRELVGRYRSREIVHGQWGFSTAPSTGLVAVFAGPSGTGKTLAAEVVAGQLGLDLYKVDLSAIVSKYIGETEKNLSQIFDAAASANVVLFFDEADALFGKRSSVQDAHDRYANIEVSYLLQRLESHDGLVILATNLQGNMDPAFLRRIHTSVEFALPDEQARRAIWDLSFPAAAPAEGVDLDFLARQFKVTGGSIRNASLAAAFLAADAGQPITMDLIVLALNREFQKLGRLRTKNEFERYFHLVDSGQRGSDDDPAAPEFAARDEGIAQPC